MGTPQTGGAMYASQRGQRRRPAKCQQRRRPMLHTLPNSQMLPPHTPQKSQGCGCYASGWVGQKGGAVVGILVLRATSSMIMRCTKTWDRIIGSTLHQMANGAWPTRRAISSVLG